MVERISRKERRYDVEERQRGGDPVLRIGWVEGLWLCRVVEGRPVIGCSKEREDNEGNRRVEQEK